MVKADSSVQEDIGVLLQCTSVSLSNNGQKVVKSIRLNMSRSKSTACSKIRKPATSVIHVDNIYRKEEGLNDLIGCIILG